MKLYEITEAYRIAMALTDETGGEITPEIQALLDAIEGELEVKADSYAALVREAKLEAMGFKEEKDRLAARQKACENRAESLKTYLQSQLEAMGLDKIKTRRFNIAIRKAGTPSIWWEGDDDIPSAYQRVKVELDGTKANEARKEGTLPDGFKVKFSQYLDIR